MLQIAGIEKWPRHYALTWNTELAGYCAGVEGREITFLAKGDRRFKVLLVPEYPVGEAEPDDQK